MQSFKQYLLEAVVKLPPNHAPWHIMDEMKLNAFMSEAWPEFNSIWKRNADGSYSTTRKEVTIRDSMLVEAGETGAWGLPFPIRSCQDIRIFSIRLTSLKGFPTRIRAGSSIHIRAGNLESIEDIVCSNVNILTVDCENLKHFDAKIQQLRGLDIINSDFHLNEIIKNIKQISISLKFSEHDNNALKQLKKGILKFVKIQGQPHIHLTHSSGDLVDLENALHIYNSNIDDEGMNMIKMQKLLFDNDLDEYAEL
jgi:hypothetical protein